MEQDEKDEAGHWRGTATGTKESCATSIHEDEQMIVETGIQTGVHSQQCY